MDQRSLRSSLSSPSFTKLFFAFLLIFSFAITGGAAYPSSSPIDEEPSSSVRIRTTNPTGSSNSKPSYLPSATRSSPLATPSPDDDYVLPIPRAFDTSIVFSNFTSPGCRPFFQNFLNNATFVNCLPLSFFLQNSKSWFDITKHGLIPVTQALTASCGVDTTVCNIVMNELGRSMLEFDNCGTEFKERNPVVMQAYASFITYPVLYAAGCQRSETGFCYADAITNTSNAADTYVYLMPLGIPIPGGARLTCSTCLQKTMKIFSAAAGNSSLPLSTTYMPAANLINVGCGPGFVNTTIAEAKTGLASSLHSRTWIPTVSIIAILSMMFL